MVQYKISLDDEEVHGAFSRQDALAVLVEKVVNAILEKQFEEQLGAKRYRRTVSRRGYRNGVRTRRMTTRVGTLTLRVPQARHGAFPTELFSRYQRVEVAHRRVHWTTGRRPAEMLLGSRHSLRRFALWRYYSTPRRAVRGRAAWGDRPPAAAHGAAGGRARCRSVLPPCV